jgi:2-polyprenyl-3-methyl-5-hydroxy-6-metoxy-1,4-benzoquinol methylase
VRHLSNDSDRNDSCQICEGRRFETLHRQEFVLPGDVRTRYTIAACLDCGFVFAHDLPSAEQYEAYYRSNLKYTYEGSRDAANALFAIHQGSFELVDGYLSRNERNLHGRDSRILYIGCSTGELLALFQRNGYRHLEGVDPTPECSQIAKELYGIDVRTAVLSELAPESQYDIVLLANVLEHIPNLREPMQRVASFMKDDGLLFVQVPDASHFGDEMREPFLEFSVEHINYFTETSLANLLGASGLVRADLRHDVVRYKGVHYPVITSLWQKKSGAPMPAIVKDASASVRSYIAKSEARLAELNRTVDALVESGEPVVIWGVGSLTARLLATTRLGEANIIVFVDSNSGHLGKQLVGRTIAAPSSLAGREVTVLISSFVYGAEIRMTLERELHYTGRIVTI